MPKKTGHRDEEAARALGAELKRIRALREKTLRAVAEHVGISVGYLQKLETGVAPLPSPHTLSALARELSADYRDLFVVAGYPLPDLAPGTGTGPRAARRSRASALGRALREEELSSQEEAELADYLQFLRRNQP